MRCELVKDWMTRDVITITPDTVLSAADKLMTTREIRRLPVVKNGRLHAIITYGDVREARPSAATSLSIWEIHTLLATCTVSEIMQTDVISITADATIGEAAQLMLINAIGSLPVIDNKHHVVGIITESDIFRMVVRDWNKQASKLASGQASK